MTVLEPCLPFADASPRRRVAWESLAGWMTESFNGFWEGLSSSRLYLQQFETATAKQLETVLASMDPFHLNTPEKIRTFLQTHFKLYENLPTSSQPARFTGYYEPVVAVSTTRHASYQVPIYRRPPQLLVIEELGYFREAFKGHRIAGVPHQGTLLPFYESKEIWGGVLEGKNLEIAWASSAIEVFFMHIQGSGLLAFEDGTSQHVTYDGTNGHPYTALGKVLKDKGLLSPSQQNMQGIKEVLAQYPGQLYDLLALNKSYVFFKELKADGPYNRLGTPLIAHRSLAVDPLYVPLGSLLWIDTSVYQGLRFAHDVGTAIKGPVRADIFCGHGESAGQEAGGLNIPGRLFVMRPE